jgi:hypothetical protein
VVCVFHSHPRPPRAAPVPQVRARACGRAPRRAAATSEQCPGAGRARLALPRHNTESGQCQSKTKKTWGGVRHGKHLGRCPALVRRSGQLGAVLRHAKPRLGAPVVAFEVREKAGKPFCDPPVVSCFIVALCGHSAEQKPSAVNGVVEHI